MVEKLTFCRKVILATGYFLMGLLGLKLFYLADIEADKIKSDSSHVLIDNKIDDEQPISFEVIKSQETLREDYLKQRAKRIRGFAGEIQFIIYDASQGIKSKRRLTSHLESILKSQKDGGARIYDVQKISLKHYWRTRKYLPSLLSPHICKILFSDAGPRTLIINKNFFSNYIKCDADTDSCLRFEAGLARDSKRVTIGDYCIDASYIAKDSRDNRSAGRQVSHQFSYVLVHLKNYGEEVQKCFLEPENPPISPEYGHHLLENFLGCLEPMASIQKNDFESEILKQVLSKFSFEVVSDAEPWYKTIKYQKHGKPISFTPLKEEGILQTEF